jgi:positive regulator of sigma E activity
MPMVKGRGGEVSATGRVVAVHGTRIRVRVRRDRACGRDGPCSAHVDFQLLPTANWQEVEGVAEEAGLAPGDAVRVTIDGRHLTRGWLLAFGVPLLGGMLGALAGNWLAGSDLGAAAGMGLGLVVAWRGSRQVARRLPPPTYRVTRDPGHECGGQACVTGNAGDGRSA